MQFKKTLSLLLGTFSLMSFAAHGNETDLTKEINQFLAIEPSQKTQKTWGQWALTPFASGLRTGGDWMRTTNDTTTIIKEEAKNQITNYMGTEGASAKLVGKLVSDETTMNCFWRGLGNGMRTVGGSLVGETLTLERVISNYFYVNSKNLSTQQMLSITACALFQTKLCGDLPKLKHTFNNFVFKINTGSSFEHVNDQSIVDESFIRGYIRYIVSNRIVKYIPNFDDELNIVMDDQSTKCMVALRKILESMDINPLISLNSAKAITIDTVFPDKEKMKDLKVTEIEQEILAAQTKAVHKFMADVFSREYVLAGSQHVFTMALEAKQGGNDNVVLQLPVNEPLLLLKNDDNNVNPLIVIQDPNQEAVKLEVGVEGNGVANNNGKEVKIDEK